jgi:hypothetical protein
MEFISGLYTTLNWILHAPVLGIGMYVILMAGFSDYRNWLTERRLSQQIDATIERLLEDE